MAAIFIETTIHIERLITEPPLQAVIEANLQANQTFSSSYVWMEFHRTIGQDHFEPLCQAFGRQLFQPDAQ